jgi:hypothetical protein
VKVKEKLKEEKKEKLKEEKKEKLKEGKEKEEEIVEVKVEREGLC